MITLTAHDYVSISLSDPEFGDSIGNVVQVKSKYTMNGDLYTNKKTSTSKKMIFSFNLPRGRALALIEFIKSYLSSRIKIEDHVGKIWSGYIITNPIPLETEVGEYGSIGFEFEGEQL